MKTLGTTEDGKTTFYCSEFVSNFEEMHRIALPPAPFAMFLAADARAVSVDVVACAAAHLLNAGLVVLCAWGPDCERVHDIFDEEYVGDGTVERASPLMTTWHAHESLEDAVEFYALNGRSLGAEATPAASLLGVAIGNESWTAAVEAGLTRFCSSR